MSNVRRVTSLVGLLFVAAATFLPISSFGKTLNPLWGSEIPWWTIVAVVLLYIVAIERRPLSSVGFRRPRILDLVLGAVTGVMGTLQATEVLKEIMGIGESLSGWLMIWDALAAEFRKVKLRRDPGCLVCGGGGLKADAPEGGV